MSLSLIFSLIGAERRASAQSECKVDCTATAPATADVNASVAFAATAASQGCASSPSYEWDFGDGTPTSLQQNPTHVYAAPGTYTWKMTASAAIGSTTIDTIAGGYGENAPARQAPFTTPVAIARDPQNRGFYVADEASAGSQIRFINTGEAAVAIAGKPAGAGKVRLLTGESGGGAGQNDWDIPASDVAYSVRGLATSADGNLLYFTDDANLRVWALNVANSLQSFGTSTLKPGNVGAIVRVNAGDLGGVAVHPTTGEVYFAQGSSGGNKVSRITLASMAIVVAGNGASTRGNDPFPPTPVNATSLPLLQPRDIAFDAAGNLFIADAGHARVVRVEAGNFAFAAIQFPNDANSINAYPAGLATIGNAVYVANGNQQVIVRLGGTGTIVAGQASTACDYNSSSCGDGGAGASATFNLAGSVTTPPLLGIDADANGLFILDQGSAQKGRVRYLNLSAAAVTLAGVRIAANNIDTIAGSGLTPPYDGVNALGSVLNAPTGVAIDANNNLFVADTLAGRVRFVNRGSNVVTLFAGTQAQQVVEPGAIVTLNKDVGPPPTNDVPVNRAAFDTPQGMTVTNQGLFIAESKGGPSFNSRRTGLIRFINTSAAPVTFFPGAATPIVVAPGHVTTLAGGGNSSIGNGNGDFARRAVLLGPSDVAVDRMTGDIYVADAGNKAVRKINGSSGIITSLNLPAAQYTGLAFDANNRLYVVNYDSGRVLREIASGSGTFDAMNQTAIDGIRDVAVDASGSAYATKGGSDSVNPLNQIVRISGLGAIDVTAGSTLGFEGDGGPAASAKLAINPNPINVAVIGTPVNVPQTVGIAIGASGEVVFTDTRNDRVRRIGPGAAQCVKTGTIIITGDNPAPAATRLTPSTAIVGGREFTISINGTGFVTGSRVRWNGADRQTNYISSTQITAIIPSTDLGRAGTASVTVFNPTPGGGTSNPLTITIAQPNPTPTISTLSPNQAATGTGFTLTVNGSGFVDASIVQWNGSARPTTAPGSTQLHAQITAADVQTRGNAEVTVFNPEPGGGVSNKAQFQITAANAAPQLTRLDPAAVVAGGVGPLIQVLGANFAATSVVRIEGQDRPTTFNDNTSLSVQLTANDIASTGVANITVFTPAPGGGVTSPQQLMIGRQASTVPASSFTGAVLAQETIASLFGVDLASGVEVATALPLPTSLRGTTVTIVDADGKQTPAPLFFVSPSQINFLVPASAAAGVAQAIVKSNDRIAGVSNIAVTPVAPGLFSANANGQGIAAGVVLRVGLAGQQTFEPIATYDQAQMKFVPRPIDLGPSGELVYLILYGSGFRGRLGLASVTATIGGVDVPVLFAGATPGLVGLDQLNLGPLPRSLAGRGVVDAVITVDGRRANVVQIAIL